MDERRRNRPPCRGEPGPGREPCAGPARPVCSPKRHRRRARRRRRRPRSRLRRGTRRPAGYLERGHIGPDGLGPPGPVTARRGTAEHERRLDDAGSREVNGITFYATRNAGGDSVSPSITSAGGGKGVLCDLNDDNFPSSDVKAISFPQTLWASQQTASRPSPSRMPRGPFSTRRRSSTTCSPPTTGKHRRTRTPCTWKRFFDPNGTVLTKQTIHE